ncbi:1-phosphofructokinase family hexose kinase [Christensenellaceae bacterium OttesenSCG-928-K19]|nr:1-phosphofructokinase family hexose kinase [Christensenellaceae bacterium OttesenSCG-928-K19]
MIICVYMNPTIDKTVYLDHLAVGGTNRPEYVVTHGGGKGVNAAVVLHTLGQPVKIMGLLYRSNGAVITDRLEKNGISHDFVLLDGEARTNTKLFDKKEQRVTEINEGGQEVTQAVIDEVAQAIINTVSKNDVVVLAGSLPPGCGDGLYAEMIDVLNQKGARCVLDTSGNALRLGVKKQPYFVKPNTDELTDITGIRAYSKSQMVAAAKRMIDDGISLVGVSMGENGALLCNKDACYYANPLQVDVLSTVGAGDSMVAGIVANIDEPVDAALRAGVAAATGSLVREGTSLCTKELFDRYSSLVKIDLL